MDDEGIEPPFYPIIYVRGYAGNDDEIEDTVSDPYMGFNLGSTKHRQKWTGKISRHYFESPLVRLMKDYNYRDVYSAGLDMTLDREIAPRSIVIYRYYDQVSATFGEGRQIDMETFGAGLGELILRVRDRACRDERDRRRFKVYLVGHSMGGLVIRCFLQNEKVAASEARALVDKVFTYASPHNGIELEVIGNVPAFFTRNSADNFNRKRMREYLALAPDEEPVRTLDGKFDVDRFFCLVGTNAKDYLVARGWSSRVVGPMSDGLVRINNALVSGTTPGSPDTRLAPHAYLHRSHSGYHGIVNSEEGYQNLTRFLFGDVRVDAYLKFDEISLPPEVQKKKDGGARVKASYHIECVLGVRGANWELSRRLTEENSSLFRTFDELMDLNRAPNERDKSNPCLFNAFLSARARTNPDRLSLGFSLDLRVLVPEYEIDRRLWLDDHFPGGYLFRDKINLEATPLADGQWKLAYGFDSETPNRVTHVAEAEIADDALRFEIPIEQKGPPGIRATLSLEARPWNVESPDSNEPQVVPVHS